MYLLLGGMAATVPNALFAIRLSLHTNKAPESYPVIFFIGEFLKIGMTLGLFMAIIRFGEGHAEDVRWLALLVGLIVALKAPLFALWIAREERATQQV